jgi:hypothetical protein
MRMHLSSTPFVHPLVIVKQGQLSMHLVALEREIPRNEVQSSEDTVQQLNTVC